MNLLLLIQSCCLFYYIELLALRTYYSSQPGGVTLRVRLPYLLNSNLNVLLSINIVSSESSFINLLEGYLRLTNMSLLRNIHCASILHQITGCCSHKNLLLTGNHHWNASCIRINLNIFLCMIANRLIWCILKGHLLDYNLIGIVRVLDVSFGSFLHLI